MSVCFGVVAGLLVTGCPDALGAAASQGGVWAAVEQASPPEAAAASGQLSGVVLARGGGHPVEQARVEVVGLGVDTFTDADGRYRLTVPAGRYLLRFERQGYEPQEKRMETRGRLQPTVFLTPKEVSGLVIVEGARAPKEVSLELLSREELEQVPGTLGDPIKALESLPGVARSKFLDGALVVRGAEPGNTVVNLDGHPLPFLYHFGIWKSVINPFFVEHLKFYPGGAPSSYGNVLQAVVEVRSRFTPGDRPHVYSDVNLADSSATILTPLPLGNARLGLSGRFSYLSLLILGLTGLSNQDAALFPHYSDLQGRLDIPLGGGTLSLLAVGARDAVELGAGMVSQDPETQDRYRAYGVSMQEPFRTSFLQLRGTFQRTAASGSTLLVSTLVGSEQQVSLLPFEESLLRLPALSRLERPVFAQRVEWTLPPRTDLVWILGGELRISRAELLDLTPLYLGADSPPTPEFLPVVALAGFGRAEWEWLETTLLIPEVRASLFGYNGKLEPWLDPRVTLRHRLAGANILKASLGSYSQLPEERAYALNANPDLKVMKSIQTSLGLERRLSPTLELETTVFGSRMWDLTLQGVDLVMEETPNGTATLSEPVYFLANGWGYGGEITLKRKLADGLTGNISYAYTRSLRDREGATTVGDYDQPHSLTLMAQGRIWERTRLSGRLRLGSGQPFTPLYGAWSPSDGQYLPIPGEENSARYQTYHQLDVRLERTLLRPRSRLTYYLDVQNLYLARNPVLALPNWNFTGLGSYLWLPLVPTLGARGEF